MLGRIIVRFLSLVLNVVGVLMILGGTLLGAWYVSANSEIFVALASLPVWVQTVVGLLAGFVVSFILVVILFGVPFLAIEINKNLVRIRDKIRSPHEAVVTLTPDLVR